ncbi:MAG: ribosome recycling factor [Candidatus Moranbacteria bacterium]|nr:ribosome recycling factor [Candidatus Moranbacteria bacterium]
MDRLKKQLDEVVDYFKEELAGIRIGRASAGLVENLEVDYYGSKSKVKQIAQISLPDSRTILISPWNKDDLVNIEKAINESDLNLNPNNNGEAVILNMPPMTEERREDLVKLVGAKAEEARVKIRQIREEKLDDLSAQKKESKLSEDEFFSKKEEVQKRVDKYNQKIDQIRENKENEIRTI